MAKTKVSANTSSQIMSKVFGDISFYSEILEKEARRLSKKYDDPDLRRDFKEMPYRSITLIPMAMYGALMKDLKRKPDRDVLAAIGLACFPIGTHDDVVDEMFRLRRTVATLVYSGNIAGLEGIRILFDKKKPEVAKALIDSINRNHYRQQKVISILWEGKEITPDDYFEGIYHIIDFVSIGLLTGLADANRKDLAKRIMRFSEGYGYAIQLIDDLRETKEDKAMGYASLPLLEEKPYGLSLELAHSYIKDARRSIPSNWKSLNDILDHAESFLKEVEEDLNG